MRPRMAKMNDNFIFNSARNKTIIDELKEIVYKKVS